MSLFDDTSGDIWSHFEGVLENSNYHNLLQQLHDYNSQQSTTTNNNYGGALKQPTLEEFLDEDDLLQELRATNPMSYAYQNSNHSNNNNGDDDDEEVYNAADLPPILSFLSDNLSLIVDYISYNYKTPNNNNNNNNNIRYSYLCCEILCLEQSWVLYKLLNDVELFTDFLKQCLTGASHGHSMARSYLYKVLLVCQNVVSNKKALDAILGYVYTNHHSEIVIDGLWKRIEEDSCLLLLTSLLSSTTTNTVENNFENKCEEEVDEEMMMIITSNNSGSIACSGWDREVEIQRAIELSLESIQQLYSSQNNPTTFNFNRMTNLALLLLEIPLNNVNTQYKTALAGLIDDNDINYITDSDATHRVLHTEMILAHTHLYSKLTKFVIKQLETLESDVLMMTLVQKEFERVRRHLQKEDTPSLVDVNYVIEPSSTASRRLGQFRLAHIKHFLSLLQGSCCKYESLIIGSGVVSHLYSLVYRYSSHSILHQLILQVVEECVYIEEEVVVKDEVAETNQKVGRKRRCKGNHLMDHIVEQTTLLVGRFASYSEENSSSNSWKSVVGVVIELCRIADITSKIEEVNKYLSIILKHQEHSLGGEPPVVDNTTVLNAAPASFGIIDEQQQQEQESGPSSLSKQPDYSFDDPLNNFENGNLGWFVDEENEVDHTTTSKEKEIIVTGSIEDFAADFADFSNSHNETNSTADDGMNYSKNGSAIEMFCVNGENHRRPQGDADTNIDEGWANFD